MFGTEITVTCRLDGWGRALINGVVERRSMMRASLNGVLRQMLGSVALLAVDHKPAFRLPRRPILISSPIACGFDGSPTTQASSCSPLVSASPAVWPCR